MTEASALGPVDPSSLPKADEEEKTAPWIVRKLVGSMTGRVVMSSYESLRAAGTSVVCLSPWGDSSPLLLPCIRFRDLAVHTVIVATGGMAAVAAPVMGPAADVVASSFGSSILVEVGMCAGFELTTKVANDLVFSKPIKYVVPLHSDMLETTGVKILLITMQFKHTMEDAALGFYRSSHHEDTSLFATVKEYLAVEKGWFSPYLFASSRRPVIPRSMTPDVIFCHGPFLTADYRVGERLLTESASTITFCDVPPLGEGEDHANASLTIEDHHSLSTHRFPVLTKMLGRSRAPSPEPALTPLPAPPTPRRMIVLVVGLKPHRKFWSTSARPGESVMNYILPNGCPSLVIPVKLGAPLVAWDGLTLDQLWKMQLPAEGQEKSATGEFEGVVDILFEYLDLCIDWARVTLDTGGDSRRVIRDALSLLVAGAVRSQNSAELKEEVDTDRAGIAMWRIP